MTKYLTLDSSLRERFGLTTTNKVEIEIQRNNRIRSNSKLKQSNVL